MHAYTEEFFPPELNALDRLHSKHRDDRTLINAIDYFHEHMWLVAGELYPTAGNYNARTAMRRCTCESCCIARGWSEEHAARVRVSCLDRFRNYQAGYEQYNYVRSLVDLELNPADVPDSPELWAAWPSTE